MHDRARAYRQLAQVARQALALRLGRCRLRDRVSSAELADDGVRDVCPQHSEVPARSCTVHTNARGRAVLAVHDVQRRPVQHDQWTDDGAGSDGVVTCLDLRRQVVGAAVQVPL
jgi:hypothetical protein